MKVLTFISSLDLDSGVLLQVFRGFVKGLAEFWNTSFMTIYKNKKY